MIYLDHNATTPIDPRVKDAMGPWLAEGFGNPSSSHAAGQAARAAVDSARRAVAAVVECESDEVVFTGGGTEADLLAVTGRAFQAGSGRVVVSEIEHEAVLHAADVLERLGFDVVRVAPARSGRVDVDAFVEACTPETVVASLMAASNETGVVQPIAEVAHRLRERGVTFHTDAVQAMGKIPVSMRKWPVDLLALSAHKFGGPKGAGALIVRRGVELMPLQGGAQEGGRRGGTHAVAQIVALGTALGLVTERLDHMGEVGQLRARLEQILMTRLDGVHVHGADAERVPNTCLVGFEGIDAGAILMAADLDDLCLSRGAACASGAEDPSHVLRAMGVPTELALGTIRISLGLESTGDDVDRGAEIVVRAVEQQRAVQSHVS